MPERQIGTVVHFFDRINVAALDITAPVSVGDVILIKGSHEDVVMPVTSMQIEHESIRAAEPGDQVALKVPDKVHKNDKVYKVTE